MDWDKTHEYKDLLEILYWDKYQNLNPPTHPHPNRTNSSYNQLQEELYLAKGVKSIFTFTKTETCQGLAVCHLKWRSRHLKFFNFEHCAHCAPFTDFEALRKEKVKKLRQTETMLVGNIFVPFFHVSFVLSFCMRLKSLSYNSKLIWGSFFGLILSLKSNVTSAYERDNHHAVEMICNAYGKKTRMRRFRAGERVLWSEVLRR